MEAFYSQLFNNLDELHLDFGIKVPKAFVKDFEKQFKIRYGDFNSGCWQASDGDPVVFSPPSMSVYRGASLLGSLPDYAEPWLSGLHRVTKNTKPWEGTNTLKDPIKLNTTDPIYEAIISAKKYSKTEPHEHVQHKHHTEHYS